jgi:hypothetical protein
MARVAKSHAHALKLMQRPSGVTTEELVKKLDLETDKQARGIVDRLRFRFGRTEDGTYNSDRGLRVIKNVGSHTFRADKRLNLRSS